MATINGTNTGETIDEILDGGSLTASDTINGLGGDDIIALHRNTPADSQTITDVVHGGAGSDTLRMDLYSPANFTFTGSTVFAGSYAETGAETANGTGAYNVSFDQIERFDLSLYAAATLTLGGGADIVTSHTTAASTINTGSGNDTIAAGPNDTVDGGAGTDTLIANVYGGYQVTMAAPTGSLGAYTGTIVGQYVGTISYSNIENFFITGSTTGDTLATGGGNDSITALDGNDLISLGKGNDTADGGTGTDTLSGDYSDEATGVTIDLRILSAQQQSGGTGSIMNFETFGTVTGSAKDDVFRETNVVGNASITSGAGNDLVQVMQGDDTIAMGAGNDTLIFDRSYSGYAIHLDGALGGSLSAGYSGVYTADYNGTATFSGVENFQVYGGSASDTIVSGDGNDVIVAGAGDDLISVGKGLDSVDGGDNTDRLSIDLSAQKQGVTIDLTLTGAQQSGGTGSIANIESFQGVVTGSGYADKLVEGNYNYAATFNMGAGNDTIQVTQGDDTIAGGTGVDTLIFDRSYTGYSIHFNDTLGGSLAAGYSGVYQGDYNGTATFSGIENFKIYGGSAADTIVTGDGDDVIVAGAGDDLISVSKGANTVDGGDNTDRLSIDLSGQKQGVTIDLTRSGAQQSGGTGSIANIESFQGSVVGTAYADKFVEGNYVYAAKFSAGAGNDTVQVTQGDDTIDGGTGSDTLIFDRSYAAYSVYYTTALSGDLAHGYAGVLHADYNGSADFTGIENFELYGGVAADTLVSGDGADLVSGNSGNDVLSVGKGADTVDGGADTDALSIDLSGQTHGVTIDLTRAGAQASGGTVSVANVESFQGTVTGTGYADSFVEGQYSYNASFAGGAGNDTVQVTAGDDTIAGGSGSDTLIFDRSYSGYSVYVTTALSGSLAAGYSGVYHADYGGTATFSGIENFKLYGGSTADTLSSGDGADLVLGNAGNDSIATAGGADTVEGGADSDTLDGGAGIDTLSYEHAASAVTVDLSQAVAQNTGGAGTDTIVNFENLLGSAFADSLTGSAVANTIDGGAGADTLTGGGGNDVYLLDTASDKVIEVAGGGTDTVQIAASYTLTFEVENLILKETGNVAGTGNASANQITGNAGANTLDGRAGADTLTGGLGDDIYYVDNIGDKIVEAANQGTDLVHATVSTTLATNVENIVLDAGNINATGNTLANHLSGSNGANVLNGGTGADTMTGGAGNDTYYIDTAGDVVVEGANAGTDTVHIATSYTLLANFENLVLDGSAGASATGNAAANQITGNGAANAIDGLAGADTMTGGGGSDTYYVDNLGDVVIEGAVTGTDLVHTTVSYTLTTNVENLILDGNAALNGTGNASANQITGNGAANSLTGGAGADTLTGGAGNDTYYVDNAGDKAIEAASQGTDVVHASVTYTLAAETENLILDGTGAIGGTGNASANQITGNSGANALSGLAGVDTLTGGAGDDTYVIDATDKLVEATGKGTDTVHAGFTYTLLTNFENLILDGTGAINGTGNTVANQLTGNAGANVLDGLAGADTMTGLGGNDIYYVDNVGDKIVEGAGAGTDTVHAKIGYTLGTNVEYLILDGTGAISGTGNTLANQLTGNAGANTLNGLAGADTLMGLGGNDLIHGGTENDVIQGGDGADKIWGDGGRDTLSGGAQADTFLFTSVTDSPYATRDAILDFSHAAGDRIDLSGIDAIAGGADDKFTVVTAFDGHAGELRIFASGSDYVIAADLDGDKTADFGITVTSASPLLPADLVL